MKNLLKYADGEFLLEEYKSFKEKLKSFSQSTPFYVYALTDGRGCPFYIGKGKGLRAFDHILKTNVSRNVRKKLDSIVFSAPIVSILAVNLTEADAYKIEAEYIRIFGRTFEGGCLENIMPGGESEYSSEEYARIGGKVGGRKTKDSGVGIFSEDYDRGAQTKLNWEMGLIPKISIEHASAAGKQTRLKQSGIFAPENQEHRSEWARNAALKNIEKNGVVGCCSPAYREENKEKLREISSSAGKIGGSITGKMPWWTNGTINTKSHISPGPDWRNGMTKKRVKDTPAKSVEIKKENDE